MPLKYIDQFTLEGKRVFLRVDFNVPLTPDGKIADEGRILASLPTIQYALKQKAKIILASHFGRPKGEKNLKYSLAPVAQRLTEILKVPEVLFPEDCVGDGIAKLSREMKPGQVLLLENLRFHKEEETNDDRFAKKLSSLCDLYINDAFGASHRAHASIVGLPSILKEKGAGFLMRREIEGLNQILKRPRHPFIALLGGAKISDKIGVLDSLLNLVDGLCIGGAMAYTFLKASGKNVGASKVEMGKLHVAKKILERAQNKGIPILLPKDHVIVQNLVDSNINKFTPSPLPLPRGERVTTEGEEIPTGWMGVDIGPKTVALFADLMQKARTIFWNGPMGIYEIEKFSLGTYSVAQHLASTKAITIIGGGDSAAAVVAGGMAEKVTHISTGGGASLEFIEAGTLPGLEILGYKP